MSHSAEEVRKQVKVYMAVFAALLTLTVTTVAARHLGLRIQATIFIALLIASVKGSLVACYFMHLIDEKKVIYWILGLTVAFFVMLISVPVGQYLNIYWK